MELIKIECTGYNSKGEGIALFNDKVFYIPGLIVGEIALCSIEYEKKKHGRARIKEILEVSKQRNFDLPPNHLEIGGYELLHMKQSEQINFKFNKVKNEFKNIAKYDLALKQLVIGKKDFRYRNKITLHDGGFYKIGTHEVIKLDDFLLTDIKPFSKLKGDIIIRKLDTLIEGNKEAKLYTTDNLLGLQIRVGINSFYQGNKEIAELAYQEIIKNIGPQDTVLDMYSGIGTISLLAAQKAKFVYGCDWSRSNYDDALYNQKINKITNIKFIKKNVGEFLANFRFEIETLIVDPARQGLGKDVCLEIIRLLPKKIIYLSCNPGTQASDFNYLKEFYEITFAQPFDMFPQTYHIENLIILNKKH